MFKSKYRTVVYYSSNQKLLTYARTYVWKTVNSGKTWKCCKSILRTYRTYVVINEINPTYCTVPVRTYIKAIMSSVSVWLSVRHYKWALEVRRWGRKNIVEFMYVHKYDCHDIRLEKRCSVTCTKKNLIHKRTLACKQTASGPKRASYYYNDFKVIPLNSKFFVLWTEEVLKIKLVVMSCFLF